MARTLALLTSLLVAGISLLSAQAPAVDPRKTVQALEAVVVQVVREAEGSVVGLLVVRGEPYDEPPKDHPGRLGAFPASERERQAARKAPHLDLGHPRHVAEYYGSGVVIDARGLILTPYHVVRDARKVYVRLPGGTGSYADIHAADPRSDLAVLQLLDPSLPLKPLPLGDAGRMRKGQFVVALAHPYAGGNRDGTPSASWGILSNVRQRPPGDADRGSLTLHHHGTLLLTDVRLPHATSGGALLNLHGELIGLTTALPVLTDTESAGRYAVPLDAAMKRVVGVLAAGREVEYGFLGVSTRDVPAEEMRAFGVTEGAVVVNEEVTPGTPAARAGLRRGDIILAVNGTRVRDGDELFLAVGTTLAGSPAELEIIRDRQRRSVTVKELAKYGTVGPVIAARRPPPVRGLRADYLTVLLAQIPLGRRDLHDRLAFALRQGGVVLVEVQPGGPAQRAGLQPQDNITHVNDRPVDSPAEFHRELQAAPGPVQLTLLPLNEKSPPRKLRLE